MIPMVDVTHDSVQRIPADLKIKVGLYITGSEDIEATLADRDRFADAAGVVLIDQSDSLDADLGDVKVVKDTEPGASKIPTTVNVVAQRHAAGKGTSPYIATGDLAALLDALRAAGELGPWVTIWEADWNLSEAEATARLGTDLGNGAIIASIQFASPTSNPDTLIPGTSIALAQANADLSVTLDAWMAKAAPAPSPSPSPRAPPASKSQSTSRPARSWACTRCPAAACTSTAPRTGSTCVCRFSGAPPTAGNGERRHEAPGLLGCRLRARPRRRPRPGQARRRARDQGDPRHARPAARRARASAIIPVDVSPALPRLRKATEHAPTMRESTDQLVA